MNDENDDDDEKTDNVMKRRDFIMFLFFNLFKIRIPCGYFLLYFICFVLFNKKNKKKKV